MYDAIPPLLISNLTVPVVYSESAPLVNASDWDEYPTFWDTDLVPIEVVEMAPADLSIPMVITFDTFDDGTNRAYLFNDTTYVAPYVPTMFTALTMGQGALLNDVYGAQTNALLLNHMDNIEINISNSDVNSHPFHLHGHKFQVVWLSQDTTSNDTTVNPLFNDTQPNPVRRDTLMIPGGGAALLRFRADNPGVWLFHCHIEWHLEAGLAATFVEAPLQAQQLVHPPQVMFDQCIAGGFPATGNVVGLNSTTDFNGEPYGPHLQYYLLGWTPKAIGALCATIIAALLGMASVVWYAMDAFKEHEHTEMATEELKKKLESSHGGIKKLLRVQSQ